jgi:hypothetical protein
MLAPRCQEHSATSRRGLTLLLHDSKLSKQTPHPNQNKTKEHGATCWQPLRALVGGGVLTLPQT